MPAWQYSQILHCQTAWKEAQRRWPVDTPSDDLILPRAQGRLKPLPIFPDGTGPQFLPDETD